MAVRTQQTKIRRVVVGRISIDVVEFDGDGGVHPLRVLAAPTLATVSTEQDVSSELVGFR